MRARPILFSGPMVQAILADRKTQTRRAVKYSPLLGEPDNWCHRADHPEFVRIAGDYRRYSPYGVPGNRLWVRETWQQFFDDEIPAERPRGPLGRMGVPATPERKSRVFYRADGELNHEEFGGARWMPSIHMPRWASRITLAVTAVRVERLQEISEEDARAEGCRHATGRKEHTAVAAYRQLWDSLNAKRGFGWDANPWVWVVEFWRLTPEAPDAP